MDTPKLVISMSHANEATEGTPRTRRSSSTVNPGESRTRSSSTTSTEMWSPQKDRRKPSMSNPYFHSSPRKYSTNFNSKSYNETIEFQAQKAREMAKQQQLQPTYRTEPQENKRFVPHIVKQVMDSTLEEALDGLDCYEPAKCRSLSVSVCEDIKQKVKWLNYDRYKLVCVVYFGSINGQEMRLASRCLWNESWDSFASSSVRKGDVYAVALMYGVYVD
ncbi:tctex1 domain-containing protein 1-A [Exaiptasia diaphana]|uniref:Uncharacterized protein n=1 Tax=Exaiptasia diaphana TaxID=2652724 RepID=A0A913XLH9_EXADI|nr:tctex1 domain-containing protein 1-A [Exaiptasia diaphana]KXJ11022.1 Tctex1 domain-containing protein 1-A [Exaiptasia diaphana]